MLVEDVACPIKRSSISTSYLCRFANHPAMAPIKDHAVFIHVDLLGQEDNAAALDPEVKWPSIQAIGEDLVNILDTLRVKCVIGLGNGAGANIMMRFAMMHVTRCLGVVLVHPTSANASMMETFRVSTTYQCLRHFIEL